MLERMWLIRAFEERAPSCTPRAASAGLLHLGIGQEGERRRAGRGARRRGTGSSVVIAPMPMRSRAARIPIRLLAEIWAAPPATAAARAARCTSRAPEVGLRHRDRRRGRQHRRWPWAPRWPSVDAGDGGVAVAVFGDGAGQAGALPRVAQPRVACGRCRCCSCARTTATRSSPRSPRTPRWSACRATRRRTASRPSPSTATTRSRSVTRSREAVARGARRWRAVLRGGPDLPAARPLRG